MAITYPLTPPATPGPIEFAWQLDSAVGETEGEFTFDLKTIVWDGKLRRASIKYPPMELASARAWQAFAMKLNGKEGTFYFKDTTFARALRGTLADDFNGGTIATGGGGPGQTITIAGLTNGATVKEGDWISISDRLYSVLNDVTVSGNTAFDIWPGTPSVIANGTAVKFGSGARGVFKLTGWPEFVYDLARLMNGFTLSVREAF